MMTKMLKKK